MNKRILIVDDEESVLNTLKRLFRKFPYDVFSALSGQEALELLETQSVDLIISDMRMPGMDGATFLKKAKEKSPLVERILLTGYSDMESTVKAINDGGIYGYMSKPWDSTQLCTLVESALDQTHKNKLKNKTLKRFKRDNDNLGEDVSRKEREVAQSAEFVNHAMRRLQDSVYVTEQMLLNLLDLKIKGQRKLSQKLVELTDLFSDLLSLNEKDKILLEKAAHLHAIGKIGIPDKILEKPVDSMSDEQFLQYKQYPSFSACTLMAYPDFQTVAQIIFEQKEYLDGSGYPNGLKGDEISKLGRIFALLLDYFELREGLVNGEHFSHEQAIKYIQHHIKRYDSALLPALSSVTLQVESSDNVTAMMMPLYSLREGMVLNQDIYSDSEILLLPKGAVLTETLIGHLMNIERQHKDKMLVSIQFLPE